MDFAGMSYSAILAAAVASFLFGGLWYGVLSKQWLAASCKTEEGIAKSGTPVVPLLIAAVCQLVMAWVLAGLIGHLGKGQVTLRNGVISAGFVWLGFIATTLIVNHAFQEAKRALTVIDGLHWLGVVLIQGAIIGWMGAT